MRVLACGDRHWCDTLLIEAALTAVLAHAGPGTPVALAHGNNGYNQSGWCCDQLDHDAYAVRGADQLAGRVAAMLGLPVTRFKPDWKQYGRRAGPIRNHQQLVTFQPDLLLVFHDHIAASRGTASMLALARRAGVPFLHVHHLPLPQKKAS